MNNTSRLIHFRLVLRSLLVQLFLNHRTMQGEGYLFAVWPWTKSASDPADVAHAAGGYLNAHPVFSAFAIGALFRRIRENEAKNTAEFTQWRDGLCGPLGLLGDQLIWDRWKPLIFGLAIVPLLIWPTIEVWVTTAVLALLFYNCGTFLLRSRGIREGMQRGAEVLSALSDPFFFRTRILLNRAALVAAVIMLAATLATSSGQTVHGTLAFATAFATAYAGHILRFNIIMILLISITLGIAVPALAGDFNFVKLAL